MTSMRAISLGFSQWVDQVAGAAAGLSERFSQPRTVRIEQESGDQFVIQNNQTIAATPNTGSFRMDLPQSDAAYPAWLRETIAGARVELTLQSDRFLFCPLELPRRATEFLHGIVRAQIDRLTPRDATGAVFGWSKPVETRAERVAVTIAATALAMVQPYCDILAKLGAHSVIVLTTASDANATATSIKVWDHRSRDSVDIVRIRKALVTTLAACVVTAIAAATTATALDAYFDNAQDEITQKRAALRAIGSDTGGAINARRSLERRKFESPSAVMVVDALSDILPDHTYITELRIEGNTVRLIGLTRDAPALIELIEGSGRFSHASFFGPTTRSASEPSERFHIEATIQPLTGMRS